MIVGERGDPRDRIANQRDYRPSLPRLLDRKAIAAELGVPLASAERIMRQVPKVKIGRRVFVQASDVQAWIKNEARV